MASKKEKAKGALSAGIDAQFGTPQQKAEPKFKRKTYLLTDVIIDDLAEIARWHKVGVNDLVRYYLLEGIGATKASTEPIPTRQETTEEVPGRIVTKTVIDK